MSFSFKIRTLPWGRANQSRDFASDLRPRRCRPSPSGRGLQPLSPSIVRLQRFVGLLMKRALALVWEVLRIIMHDMQIAERVVPVKSDVRTTRYVSALY
jgi:hypothetical protein